MTAGPHRASRVPGNKGGESETALGIWMAARRNRHAVVMATKVCGPMGSGPHDKGLSRQHIVEGVEASGLGLGDVPRQHRRAVQAVAKRAHEVGVARELPGRHRRELVDAEPQIARRRAQAR